MWSWASTTCEDCLYERRLSRRRWTIAGVIGVAVIAALGAYFVAIILGSTGADEPMLSQSEVDQTIVARGIQATLRSVEETMTYPTRQVEAATRAVEQTKKAHAAVAERTRIAGQSARATRDAPAPRSVYVRGMNVICREIAYEYVYMAPAGKLEALNYVASNIFIRGNDHTVLVSAHNAENALAQCQCFSPTNCKPLK